MQHIHNSFVYSIRFPKRIKFCTNASLITFAVPIIIKSSDWACLLSGCFHPLYPVLLYEKRCFFHIHTLVHTFYIICYIIYYMRVCMCERVCVCLYACCVRVRCKHSPIQFIFGLSLLTIDVFMPANSKRCRPLCFFFYQWNPF